MSTTMNVVTKLFSKNANLQLAIRKLNGKNYLEWAHSMKLAVEDKGKLGHLTGKIQ